VIPRWALSKAVKDALGLGLKDAKELVEKAPVALKENVSKDEADELVKKLDGTGAEARAQVIPAGF